jgi:hypothetical protein
MNTINNNLKNIENKYKLLLKDNNKTVYFKDYINNSKNKYPNINCVKLDDITSLNNNFDAVFDLKKEKFNIFNYCQYYKDYYDEFKKSIDDNNLFIVKINIDTFLNINNINNKYELDIKIDKKILNKYYN